MASSTDFVVAVGLKYTSVIFLLLIVFISPVYVKRHLKNHPNYCMTPSMNITEKCPACGGDLYIRRT
jgi:hypothetical protein